MTPETKNIHEDTGWYLSYMDDKQGMALIECQQLKIQQQANLLKRIMGEIELADQPVEYSPEMVLQSIKAMLESKKPVEATRGHFKWVG